MPPTAGRGGSPGRCGPTSRCRYGPGRATGPTDDQLVGRPLAAHHRQVLSSITAQVAYRRRTTANEQPTFGSTSLTLHGTHADASVSLSWFGGCSWTLDGTRARNEQSPRATCFRTTRDQRSAALTFSFRPPAWLEGGAAGSRRSAPPLGMRTRENPTCLRSAGQGLRPLRGQPLVQAPLTMDTTFPHMIAGFRWRTS